MVFRHWVYSIPSNWHNFCNKQQQPFKLYFCNKFKIYFCNKFKLYFCNKFKLYFYNSYIRNEL